jgi:hypothetical protein
MAEQDSYAIADFNNRLVDLEERNRIIRERVVLLGNNLISIRDDLFKEIEALKKQTVLLNQEVEKLTLTNQNIISEINNFVKKPEMAIIERMLRDFQPLEFARMKDVEELLKKNKDIKTTKTQ